MANHPPTANGDVSDGLAKTIFYLTAGGAIAFFAASLFYVLL